MAGFKYKIDHEQEAIDEFLDTLFLFHNDLPGFEEVLEVVFGIKDIDKLFTMSVLELKEVVECFEASKMNAVY